MSWNPIYYMMMLSSVKAKLSLFLEFQKRVLYLLTDIKDILQNVCRKYEEPASDFHIEKAENMDDFQRMMQNLKVIEYQKRLVSILH